MTPILFHFLTSTGEPLATTPFEIQLTRSDYDEEISGIVMPRLVEAVTDEEGKATVELTPTDTLYHVTVYDKFTDAALHYEFYVPVSVAPVRLQDIVVDAPMSPKFYDEAALILINATKVAILGSKTAAEQAAIDSQASADAAEVSNVSAIAAVATISGMAAAVEVDHLAAEALVVSAQAASDNSIAQAANALASQNAAAVSASTADAEATIATTKAAEATVSATMASTNAAIAVTQAGIATTKADEASTSAGTATTGATTATTQAGIATTKAGEALTSANNAATSAAEAATTVVNRLRIDVANQGLTAQQKLNGLTNLGVANINNTADVDKPVSTAQQTALNLKTTATVLAAQGGAALVGNTPAGNIQATTVQAAINELDTEKASVIYAGFHRDQRNRILNPDSAIDQRNSGAAVLNNGSGVADTVDRVVVWGTVPSKLTSQQYSVILGNTQVTNSSQKITVTSQYTPGAAENYNRIQRIEGIRMRDLLWGSSYARPMVYTVQGMWPIAGTYSVAFRNGTSTRSFVSTFTVAQANTLETHTILVPGDTAGTWATDNTCHTQVSMSLGTGANATTSTLNQWLTGGFVKAAGTIDLVAQANGTAMYIAWEQYERDMRTDFEIVQPDDMLRYCQRYYETGVGSIIGGGTSGVYCGQTIGFKVTKRIAPAVTLGTPTEAVNLTAVAANNFSPDAFRFYGNVTATGASYYTNTWAASAEL